MHYLEYVTKGHSQVIRYLYVAGTCMYLTALLDGIASGWQNQGLHLSLLLCLMY